MSSGRRFFVTLALFSLAALGPVEVWPDVTGDGTDEIGAFAVEVRGQARGPWYQIWEADGTTVASRFLLPGYHGFQFQTIDTNGNGAEELVILATHNAGATILQVRSRGGAVLAEEFITSGLFTEHQLFPINFDGGAAVEIGVGLVRSSDGTGIYQIWRRTGLTLSKLGSGALTGPPFGMHQWRAGDFDEDGNEEVFVSFLRKTNRSAYYRVWDPQTSSWLGSVDVAGPSFAEHQWVLGDFDTFRPGLEILVGYTRVSDGAAFFQVRDETGTLLGNQVITGANFDGHHWDRISNGIKDLVFVGFQRISDGLWLYHVWNATPASGPPVKVGGQFVLTNNFQVVRWLTGNFGGDPANGDEVLIGYKRVVDGAIGFQTWNLTGTQRLGNALVLGGEFNNAQFQKLHPITPLRHDLLVGASRVSGPPVIQLWRTNTFGGVLLLTRSIFSGNVL